MIAFLRRLLRREKKPYVVPTKVTPTKVVQDVEYRTDVSECGLCCQPGAQCLDKTKCPYWSQESEDWVLETFGHIPTWR